MAEIVTNIPLTYREEDGDLISPIKGKPTTVSEAMATSLKASGLAEDYSGGGSSDFSTATVTNNLSQNITFVVVGDINDGEDYRQNAMIAEDDYFVMEGEKTVLDDSQASIEIVALKTPFYCRVLGGSSAIALSVDGNARVIEDPVGGDVIEATGDFSLVVNEATNA